MTSQPKRNLEAFFSGEEWVLKKTFIRGGSAPRSNFLTLLSVADLGDRRAREARSPLIFRPNWGIPLISGWPPLPCECLDPAALLYIQLFRERLSEKVHVTIPKGIVGGFGFTVLQRNLKELARKAMKMCLRVLTESNKSRFDSYSRQEQCIDHIPYYLSGLSRAHFFRPFSK